MDDKATHLWVGRCHCGEITFLTADLKGDKDTEALVLDYLRSGRSIEQHPMKDSRRFPSALCRCGEMARAYRELMASNAATRDDDDD